MKNIKIVTLLVFCSMLSFFMAAVSDYLINKQNKTGKPSSTPVAKVEDPTGEKPVTNEPKEEVHKDGIFSYLEKNIDDTYTLILSSTSDSKSEEEKTLYFIPNDYSMGTYSEEYKSQISTGPQWYNKSEDVKVTKVIIKNKVYPTKLFYWFNGYSDLKEIEGLENIDFSNIENTAGMFAGCSSLTTLDLSKFDMKKVTNTISMFAGCSNLKTIYVNKNLWDLTNVEKSDFMFYGDTNLTGSNGTMFDSEHTDKTYAKIDNNTEPGYLTNKK